MVVKTLESAENGRGFVISTDTSGGGNGTIADVVPGSPAAKAGITPGMKLLAVNGRRWSADVLHDASSGAKRTRESLQIFVANGDFYTTATVAAFDGNRYPHLERDPSKPDLLSRIYAPRTFAAPPVSKKKE